MRVREKVLYDCLKVEEGHIKEPGQKAIREFINKTVASAEIYPSAAANLSRLILHFPGGTRIELYPGYYIVRDPANKIKVLNGMEFNIDFEIINK